MKYVPGLLLCLAVAMPGVVAAQEEPAPEDAAATDSNEALEAVAEDAAAEAEAQATGEEVVETVPVDTGEETAEAEPAAPWRLYLGLDQVSTTLALSELPPGAPNEFDSGIYRLRTGVFINDNASLELHYGIKQSAGSPDEVETENYYGLFVVPSTNLFDTLELAFPLGYAKTTLGGESHNSAAFGIDIELPIQYYLESLPDLRLTLGWMTYYQKHDARLYGLNFGLRFDFGFEGGNPFAGLWPFGGEAEGS